MSSDKRITRSNAQKTTTNTSTPNRVKSGTSTPYSPRCSKDKPKEENILHNMILKLSDQITTLTKSVNVIGEKVDKLEKLSNIQSSESENIKTKLMEVSETADNINLTTKWVDSKITEEQNSKRVEKESNLLKDEHNVVWKEAMNARKTSFWHGLQNYKKAELYTEWIDSSPEYLPLKYRPKVNTSDSRLAVEQKVKSAKTKYRDDINLMMHYVDNHDENVWDVEERIEEIITEIAPSEDHKITLLEMWRNEVIINENISRELWNKKYDFFQRKKQEEEKTGNYKTVDEKSNKLRFTNRTKSKHRFRYEVTN